MPGIKYISDQHERIFVSEEINNKISIYGREKKNFKYKPKISDLVL